MAASRFFALLLAAVAIAGAAVVGLTTYTLPLHGGAPYGAIEDLISRALHDSSPTLPGPPPALGLTVMGTAPSKAESREVDTLVAAQALAWAGAAAAADSAALRAWLGPAVLATAATELDSVRLTLRRIALEPGCPLVSTLHADFAGAGRMRLRLLRVSASCPALPSGAGR